MKRLLFGIFAHPDDEAFGPSATLIKEVQSGTELHVVCATRGEQGANPDKQQNLGEVRLEEWRRACKLIGAAKSYNLDYADGTLCNQLYHELAGKIEKLIRATCESQTQPVELALMTFDRNGLTGHLDHIAISYITTFVFYRLQAAPPAGTQVKDLAYFCFSEAQAPQPQLDYFVFMPAGQKADYINRRVEVSSLLDMKFDVMRIHHSQRTDAEQFMAHGQDFHRTDNFRVVT